MKLSRKLFALLLVFVLALSLASPAFADDPDSAMPVIIVQPQNVVVTPGILGMFETDKIEFTLSVEASIPNGDPVGYQWYRVEVSSNRKIPIQGETKSTYSAYIGDVRGVSGWDFSGFRFYCVVYNAAEGLEGEHKVASAEVGIERYPSLFSSVLKLLASVVFLPLSILVPFIPVPALFLPFPLTMLCIQGIMDGIAGIKHYFGG